MSNSFFPFFASRFATAGGSNPDPPPAYSITGTTYYVSTSRNDFNSGTPTSAPWVTIGRTLSQTYTADDGLLFERGSTYYGNIDITPTPSGIKRLVIGAYRSGNKLVINACKILDYSGSWVNTGGNIWRLQVTNSATHSGNHVTQQQHLIGVRYEDGLDE